MLNDQLAFDCPFKIGQELIISQSFINPNKRNLLSLEGKSSLIIYEAADIDSAIEAIVDGCFYANGQVSSIDVLRKPASISLTLSCFTQASILAEQSAHSGASAC